jgi:hypothetical protein
MKARIIAQILADLPLYADLTPAEKAEWAAALA